MGVIVVESLLKQFNEMSNRIIVNKPGHYMVMASRIYLDPKKEVTFEKESKWEGNKVWNLLIFEPGRTVTEYELEAVYKCACGLCDCLYGGRQWASYLADLFFNFDKYTLNGKIFEWWVETSRDDYAKFNSMFRSIVNASIDGVCGTLPGLIKKKS